MAGYMLGYIGLYIAATLFVNVRSLQGKAPAREVAILNLIIGIVASMNALYNGFILNMPLFAAQGSLFAFTYLWLAYVYFTGQTDLRGFGWYCFFVVAACIPFTAMAFVDGMAFYGIHFASWAYIWFLFGVLCALQKASIFKLTCYSTYAVALFLGVSSIGWLYGWWAF
jgi:hypothetical protein